MTSRAPARVVPLLYFGTAHIALALAAWLAAWWPQAVAGFFYHSWMVAIVHLVTLGWITCSILGALYIAGPPALAMALPARRGDGIAYGLVVVGLIGMVAHFWIQEFGGMAWSAATATCGILYVAGRVLCGVHRARLPRGVALHVVFACLNVVIAASMGVLLGFDKAHHFLPGFVMTNVFAHAHLAALGWAAMMLIGMGSHLLPGQSVPAPSNRSTAVSAIVLEIGVLGLFVALLTGSAWTRLFAVTIAAGLLVFVLFVVRMVRTRRPDFAVLHAAGAMVFLAAASALGIGIVVLPATTRTLHMAAAYGVFGLIGFLAQMVVAIEVRLAPLVAPASTRDRALQAIAWAGWTIGVPLFAAGMFLESALPVRAGAWALFAAVVLGGLDLVFALLPARSGRASVVTFADLRKAS